jgi:hypothetical protein
MSSEFLVPRPLALLTLIHNSHTTTQLALDSSDSTALLALLTLTLDIGADDKRLALQSPLYLCLFDPVDSLARATTTTSLHLLFLGRMATPRAK